MVHSDEDGNYAADDDVAYDAANAVNNANFGKDADAIDGMR